MFGLASYARGGTFSYGAWLNGSDPTRASYYLLLAAAPPPLTTLRGDVRHLVGRGPFNLAPGRQVSLYFAILGGDSRAAFTATASGAAARAAELGYP
jgi:hypothetical protein